MVSEALRERSKFEGTLREQITLAIIAACGFALSNSIIAIPFYFLLALSSLEVVRPALAQSAPNEAEIRLQAGIVKETVYGDLKGAMVIYEGVAADKSAPRDIRATAMLRLGRCDESLGKQAGLIYEQIVRDFGEQPAAIEARKRLIAMKRRENSSLPPTMTARKIDWPKLGFMGPTDSDGKKVVYYVAPEGLYFGDLGGHSKRLVLKVNHVGWIPCHDFSLILLDLLATPERPHTLAVVRTDGTGYRELIRDDAKNSIFGWNQSFSMSCSWDDRTIALSDFSVRSPFPGQLWIVSAVDGSRRIVANLSGVRIRTTAFSPDGEFVVFEVHPDEWKQSSTSRIFIVPVRGGEPRLIYESTPWQAGNGYISLLDWTADGRFLAVRDFRNGRSALYLVPIKNGVATGDPVFVRFGEFDDASTTASGALIYSENAPNFDAMDVSIAAMGKGGRPETWRKLDLTINRLGGPEPSFSPDGNQLAYLAYTRDPPLKTLLVRDLSTRLEREVFRSPDTKISCQFSAIHPKVFCAIQKEENATELVSIAVDSAAVEHIATIPGSRYIIQPTLDDETFYFADKAWRYGPYAAGFMKWNRATQEETVLEPDSPAQVFGKPSIDGRWLTRMQDRTVFIRSIPNGDWKPLATGDLLPYPPLLAPDGNWVWYQARDSAGIGGLYRVPVGGGAFERMGDLPNGNSGGAFFFSPDGSKVLAVSSSYGHYDLWVLENFEPPAHQ